MVKNKVLHYTCCKLGDSGGQKKWSKTDAESHLNWHNNRTLGAQRFDFWDFGAFRKYCFLINFRSAKKSTENTTLAVRWAARGARDVFWRRVGGRNGIRWGSWICRYRNKIRHASGTPLCETGAADPGEKVGKHAETLDREKGLSECRAPAWGRLNTFCVFRRLRQNRFHWC